MRINHKLLRHARIKLPVAARCLIEADDFDPDNVGNFDPVPHDRLHQLAVVFHHRGLPGMKAVGFGPAQSKADAQAAHFGGGIHSAGVFGHVQPRNADFARHPHHAHQ